ncbi:MAG: hypothetical protein Q8O67_30465 [Deltaproteobacteria bacterium]|nr:hypothetical protein [Deltaproteobacteria bacterium]
MANLMTSRFAQKKYTIRRPFLTLFGRKFHVFGADGQQVLFVKHKIFSLKDEWSMFSDDSEKTPMLRVKARQLIGLNIITDVFDAATNEKVGAVRNQGLKSLFKDTWEILDDADQPVGKFAEDSNALLRRFLPFMRGHWSLELGGAVVAKLDQEFRFFTKEFTLDLSMNSGRADTRLALAVAMLALMREIARESR